MKNPVLMMSAVCTFFLISCGSGIPGAGSISSVSNGGNNNSGGGGGGGNGGGGYITITGSVSTIAGKSGGCTSAGTTTGTATFDNLGGISVDTSGNIFVVEDGTSSIRKIDTNGNVSYFAGTPSSAGNADGGLNIGQFAGPIGLAIDSTNHLYVADFNNNLIRKVSVAGVISTLPGSGTFHGPAGVAVDSGSNVYIADTNNSVIRKISSGGVVTLVAGTGGTGNDDNADPLQATFDHPQGIAVDSSGNIYVADTNNSTIRKIAVGGEVTTVAGSAGVTGTTDGPGATTALFNSPQALTVDASGNIYVADTSNYTVRKIDTSFNVTTVAGSPGNQGSVDGTTTSAKFIGPSGIAIDNSGYLYVSDNDVTNCKVRKIQ